MLHRTTLTSLLLCLSPEHAALARGSPPPAHSVTVQMMGAGTWALGTRRSSFSLRLGAAYLVTRWLEVGVAAEVTLPARRGGVTDADSDVELGSAAPDSGPPVDDSARLLVATAPSAGPPASTPELLADPSGAALATTRLRLPPIVRHVVVPLVGLEGGMLATPHHVLLQAGATAGLQWALAPRLAAIAELAYGLAWRPEQGGPTTRHPIHHLLRANLGLAVYL